MELSNLLIKKSYPPAELSVKTPGPGSRSTVPLRLPTEYRLPFTDFSILTPMSSNVVEEIDWAQLNWFCADMQSDKKTKPKVKRKLRGI